MADPKGGGGFGTCFSSPPTFLDFFFFLFAETKFTSKKLYVVLNENEICLKMLEMAVLETRISEISGRGVGGGGGGGKGACPRPP